MLTSKISFSFRFLLVPALFQISSSCQFLLSPSLSLSPLFLLSCWHSPVLLLLAFLFFFSVSSALPTTLFLTLVILLVVLSFLAAGAVGGLCLGGPWVAAIIAATASHRLFCPSHFFYVSSSYFPFVDFRNPTIYIILPWHARDLVISGMAYLNIHLGNLLLLGVRFDNFILLWHARELVMSGMAYLPIHRGNLLLLGVVSFACPANIYRYIGV
jgi:hypothetical protein